MWSPFPILAMPRSAVRCPIGTPETAAPAPGNEHAARWGGLSSPHYVIHPGERPARRRNVDLPVGSLGGLPTGLGALLISGPKLLRRVSEIVAEFAEERRFSPRAHHAGNGFASLEHDQGGDGHHLVLLSGQGVSVNVELGHGEAFDVFGGDLFEHWCHGAAGSTPWGPEVHQYGCGTVEDVGRK